MDVVIIGAGLAGLCCDRSLNQAGIPFLRGTARNDKKPL